MCQAAPGNRCMAKNHLRKDLNNARQSLDDAQWQLDNNADPAAVKQLKADVADKQQIVDKHEHSYDIAVIGSYTISKATLKKEAEKRDPAEIDRIERGLEALEKKMTAHDAKIAKHKAAIQKLKAKGGHTLAERRKHEEAIHKLNATLPLSRKEQQEAHDLQEELKRRMTAMPADELEHHQAVVARGDQIKAEGRWDTLRRERTLRDELAKYEAARKKYGDLSAAEAFPNPRMLVDALTELPKFPHRKGGGGRDLTEAEQAALDSARAYIRENDVEDYLEPSTPTASREMKKPVLGGSTRKTSSSGSRELKAPVLQGNRPTASRNVPGSIELERPAVGTKPTTRVIPPLPALPPRPVLKGNPPANSHKIPGSRELARPVLKGDSDSPAATVSEKPKPATPTLAPRPQALRDRSPSEPETKPRPSIVKRILGGRG